MKTKLGILFLCLTIIGVGCYVDPYANLVKKELARKERMDSLFLDMKFGMTSKEFFTQCWELNKKGVITDGTNNTSVLYKIPTALKYPASMNFYPDFYQDKIYKMRVSFQFDAWAPWNKQLNSDSLMPRVLDLYRSWYPGNDFMKLTDPKRGTIYVKVDGNRRIVVGKSNEVQVNVDYTNLLIENKLPK